MPFRLPITQLLQNGPIILYFQQHILEETRGWFRQQNYKVVSFDCRQWKSREDFFSDVSQRLNFPEYCGRNLDAFNDCLSGIALPESRGTILVFLRFEIFAARHPQFAWEVLDIIATNAYRFLLDAYQLITLVQSDDPKLSFQPALTVNIAPSPSLPSSPTTQSSPSNLSGHTQSPGIPVNGSTRIEEGKAPHCSSRAFWAVVVIKQAAPAKRAAGLYGCSQDLTFHGAGNL